MRAAMTLIFLAAAAGCGTKEPADSGDGGAGSGDASITALDAAVSDAIRTVITVSWSTDSAVQGYVEFGLDESLGRATPLEDAAGTEHSALLLGLPADTEVFYRVVADGADKVSEIQSVSTGSLPNELPGLSVTGSGHSGFMATPLLGAVVAPVIIDGEGNIVWYWQDDRGLDVYRVKLSLDGRSVLYNSADITGEPSPDSAIVRVALDGSSEEAIPVPLLAHDFVEFPDGTIGALAYEYREDATLGEVKGNQIVEIAPDGSQSVIWSAWDCYDPNVIEGADPELGWSFTNALDYDPEADAYYVGFRNFSSIVKVNRADGSCEWALGGEAGTIEIDGIPFLYQHQFEVREDSVIVFDNASQGLNSRAVEYAVDWEAGTAEEIWSWQPDPPVQVFVLGDVTRMGNGDTLVTWSTAGQINRATPGGESTWQLNTEIGYVFAFDSYSEDIYITP